MTTSLLTFYVSTSKGNRILSHLTPHSHGQRSAVVGSLCPREQAHPAAREGWLWPTEYVLFSGHSILDIAKSGLFVSYSMSACLPCVFHYLVAHSFWHVGRAASNLPSFALVHCSIEISVGRLGGNKFQVFSELHLFMCRPPTINNPKLYIKSGHWSVVVIKVETQLC